MAMCWGRTHAHVLRRSCRHLRCRHHSHLLCSTPARDSRVAQLEFHYARTEMDRAQKVALYGQLAALTLAPVGGLVPDDATSVALQPARNDTDAGGAVGEALRLWGALVEDRHAT